MTAPIRLIVGLGNPGPEYEATRHNAGFWLADHFADDLHATFTLDKTFFAWVARARHAGEAVTLAKPATFMNRSGQAVGALARFYKLRPEQILVLHDELDLPPGSVKLKQGEVEDKQEHLDFLQGKIAKWWMPDDVVFVNDIPLGATGKIDKKTLRERMTDYRLPTAG